MKNSMQKEIQLTDKTLLVVGLPKEVASKLTIDNFNNKLRFLRSPYFSTTVLSIPSSRYKVLGIYPELTEEQAKAVVDYGFCSTNGCELFECYTDEESVCSTALESFQSLMERENITGYDKYAILIKSK